MSTISRIDRRIILPAVSVRNTQTGEATRSPNQAERLKSEIMHSETINDVSKTLPGQHIDKCVGHVIRHRHVGVGRLDVRKGMREDLGRRPRHREHHV